MVIQVAGSALNFVSLDFLRALQTTPSYADYRSYSTAVTLARSTNHRFPKTIGHDTISIGRGEVF